MMLLPCIACALDLYTSLPWLPPSLWVTSLPPLFPHQATSPEKRATYLAALSYAQYTDDIFSVLQYALSSEVRLVGVSVLAFRALLSKPSSPPPG